MTCKVETWLQDALHLPQVIEYGVQVAMRKAVWQRNGGRKPVPGAPSEPGQPRPEARKNALLLTKRIQEVE